MTVIYSLLFLLACSSGKNDPVDKGDVSGKADVVAVSVSGQPGAYTFNTTVSSPDEGCQQYANWWEVVSADETLLYRRILRHSHVNEQPFARTGGPVAINQDDIVWIRAHMNNTGYGGEAFKGSVSKGFVKTVMPEGFAAALETQDPQPGKCPF
ncbi:hypothetical protein QQ020_20865 [Fulvivirgaceae bacterium BMA12]|uniref:Lipoprotein n=1 Tax=Agaribacillus aureus TaxID=3051825 RepID=A0ABT8L9V9_9BACT|nr:hypothetical protein [Fulvivirgaceae bacterium BMA12]